MANYLRWVTDPAGGAYAQRVAQTSGLPVDTIHRQVGPSALPPFPEGGAPPRRKDSLAEESHLLRLLAVDPSLAITARRDGVGELLSGRTPGKPSRTWRTWPSGPPGDRIPALGKISPTACENFCPPARAGGRFPGGGAQALYPGRSFLRIRRARVETGSCSRR